MTKQDILLQEIKPSYADKKATQTIGTCVLGIAMFSSICGNDGPIVLLIQLFLYYFLIIFPFQMVSKLKNNSDPVIGTISDVRLSRTANMPLADNFSIPTRSSVAIPYIYLQTDDREYVISVRNNKQFKQLLELGPEVWHKLKVPIYASASPFYLVYADFDNMYFSETEGYIIKDFY